MLSKQESSSHIDEWNFYSIYKHVIIERCYEEQWAQSWLFCWFLSPSLHNHEWAYTCVLLLSFVVSCVCGLLCICEQACKNRAYLHTKFELIIKLGAPTPGRYTPGFLKLFLWGCLYVCESLCLCVCMHACMCVCVCVCLPLRLLITSGMIWHDNYRPHMIC